MVPDEAHILMSGSVQEIKMYRKETDGHGYSVYNVCYTRSFRVQEQESN